MPNLVINVKSNKQLQELSKKRKAEESPVVTKKGIVEDLINTSHKKEIKS